MPRGGEPWKACLALARGRAEGIVADREAGEDD